MQHRDPSADHARRQRTGGVSPPDTHALRAQGGRGRPPTVQRTGGVSPPDTGARTPTSAPHRICGVRMLPLVVAACIALAAAACERDPLPPDIPDVIAPLPPAQLRFEANSDGVVLLEWKRNGEPDLDHYELHRAEAGAPDSFRVVAATTQFWVVDRALSYDTLYTYYVTAVDRSGNRSAASNRVSLTSPNRYAPWEPDDAWAAARNDGDGMRVTLSWTASDDDDIARYRIYRSAVTPPTWPDPSLLLAETEQLSHVDRLQITTGVTYHYLVTAVDHGGLESEKAAKASDHVLARPALVAPADGAFVPSFGIFEWNDVGAASYELEILHGGGVGRVWAGTIGAQQGGVISVQYGGPGLEAGRIYAWRVLAYSRPGEEPNSVSELRSFQVR